jgi:hypothetical protein
MLVPALTRRGADELERTVLCRTTCSTSLRTCTVSAFSQAGLVDNLNDDVAWRHSTRSSPPAYLQAAAQPSSLFSGGSPQS